MTNNISQILKNIIMYPHLKNLLIFLKNGFFNFLKNPSFILITFLNIGFFMLVQIMFFYFFASKQLDTIIKSKMNILQNFISYDTYESRFVKKKLKKYINSDIYQDNKNKSSSSQLIRNKNNKLILFEKLKYFLIPIISIIILCIIYFIVSYIKYGINNNTDKYRYLSVSDWILIFFVFGAFTTELIFYFSIVRKHEFTGDMEIINILYTSIAKNFNKK